MARNFRQGNGTFRRTISSWRTVNLPPTRGDACARGVFSAGPDAAGRRPSGADELPRRPTQQGFTEARDLPTFRKLMRTRLGRCVRDIVPSVTYPNQHHPDYRRAPAIHGIARQPHLRSLQKNMEGWTGMRRREGAQPVRCVHAKGGVASISIGR